jgi:hypothetical protein
MKFWYPRSLHFLKRNLSRSIATKVVYSNVTSHESLLKALGGSCKVKFPLPQDSCCLRPSVEISKDSRKLIAKDISSSLSYADLLLSKSKESNGKVLIVYSILKEILRYGHGDLMYHFKAPTGENNSKFSFLLKCMKSNQFIKFHSDHLTPFYI